MVQQLGVYFKQGELPIEFGKSLRAVRLTEHEFRGQVGQLRQDHLEAGRHQFLLIFLEHHDSHFVDGFPSINDKHVPDTLELPQSVRLLLRLQHLREERDKEGCAKQRAIYIFLFEVIMDFRSTQRYQPVHPIETLF